MNIAKLLGWEPSEKQKENPASAIGFLERKFPVPYDARYDKDLGITNEANSTGMSSSNHHLKSLAHSPDFVGLLFSLVDQFSTDESGIKHTTIISNSHIEMYSYGTTDFELKGKNIVSKLFCGIANWICIFCLILQALAVHKNAEAEFLVHTMSYCNLQILVLLLKNGKQLPSLA